MPKFFATKIFWIYIKSYGEFMAEKIEKKKHRLTKQQYHYISSITTMVLVTALAVYYVLKDNAAGTFSTLGSANIWYILAMAGIMLLSYCIEGSVLMVFSKIYKRKYRLYQGVLNGLIGNFFSSITPFASGGQFVQAYTFSKQGIKAPNAASILVMLFIVSQTAIIIMGTLAISLGYQSTIVNMSDVTIFGVTLSPITFSVIGFVISILILLSLFVMSYSKHLHHFILNTCINLGAKWHLIRDPERKRMAIAAQVATFRIELSRLFKNGGVLIITVVLEFAKFFCWHTMPYFAGLSLGAEMSGKFWECIWSNAYLQMITSFIPIPGASGGAEAGFQLLFSSIYLDPTITSAANLLSRGLTFYLTLIVGFIVFVSYKGSPKKNIYEYNNRETFVDLQIISIAESKEANLREVEIIPPTEKENSTQTLSLDQLKTGKKKEKKKKKLWPWMNIKSSGNWDDEAFASPEGIKASFQKIKNSLILRQKDIYEEDDQISQVTRHYLKGVYDDVENLAAQEGLTEVHDTEVELAIKKDLDELMANRKRKQERAKKRDLKRKKKYDAKIAHKEKKLKGDSK